MLIKDFANSLSNGARLTKTKKNQVQPWYTEAAVNCFRRGHYHFIPQRTHKNRLYLARFWLTKPAIKAGFAESSYKYESGNSVLLHYFASADDDNALHSHPWEWFHSTILEGWYDECVPNAEFNTANQDKFGPDMQNDCVVHRRNVRERMMHSGKSLHSVVRILKHTWTLVNTGPRMDNWGFYPSGKPFVHWKEYLGYDD